MPKCVQLNLASLDIVHVLCQNGRKFGSLPSFHLISASAMCFICYFRCYLEITATSRMLHLWFLSILFLWDTYCMGSCCHYSCFIPGCLHTSLGLWLACWIISKPGVGHDIVVILWFVKCFVMDCLNWRLIKYWQLWQNARWVFCLFVCLFGHFEKKKVALNSQYSLEAQLSQYMSFF